MKRIISLLTLLVTLSIQSQSQQLYYPKSFKKAILNNTRSENGYPGKKFWKNRADYKIEASLDVKNSVLRGKETITYYNNSPNYLNRIYIHLYQNIYKRGVARIVDVSTEDLHDGVEIHKMKINGIDVNDNPKLITDNKTILSVYPAKAIDSGEKCTIYIEWNFKIPAHTYIRMGRYSDTSFFLGQWFPKVAVYDDIFGWDDISYNGLAEFYPEYGNYDVKIKVPEGYIVWATGTLQNPKSVLSKEFYKRYKKIMTKKNSNHSAKLISRNDLNSNKSITKKDFTTWHFKAKDIPDFAFGTNRNFIWECIHTKEISGKKVLIQTAYHPNSKDFYDVIDVAKTTVEYLSEEFPALPYPYPQMTVYNGHGGMEYPMIVNDGNTSSRSSMVFITSHEIAHTYFPFFTGMSEARYGWFDEGITMFLPIYLQDSLSSAYSREIRQTSYYQNNYTGKSVETVTMTPTFNIDTRTYYEANYVKSEVAFRMFQYSIGKNKFASLIRKFLKVWKGKHPTPYDFFNFTNTFTKENYSWYWKKWFFEYNTPDIAIKKAVIKNNTLFLNISNKGGIPVPIVINLEYTDSSKDVVKYSILKWRDSDNVNLEIPCAKKIKSITIGNIYIPDVDEQNNVYNF